jgi:hypothetical protein
MLFLDNFVAVARIISTRDTVAGVSRYPVHEQQLFSTRQVLVPRCVRPMA